MADQLPTPLLSLPCEDLLLVKSGQEAMMTKAFESAGLTVATFEVSTWRVVTTEGWRYGYAQDDRKFYFLGVSLPPASAQ